LRSPTSLATASGLYRGTSAEAGVRHRAAIIDAAFSGISSALYVDEQGTVMANVATASERTGQTDWARKYGRFYTLSVVRWLSDIFGALVHEAVYIKNIDALFGHNEFFTTYRVPNSFLLTRKLWPLK
jgi:hypothetical protein